MNPDPSAEVIGANAEKIARILDRRLSPKRLSGAARDAVMGAVFKARRTGDISTLAADLEGAAAGVERRTHRAYTMCRLLLEAAWAVPADSDLERVLARRLRAYFVQCKADGADQFDALRKEFVACQRSSLPAVRRLVGDTLFDEPPDPSEIALLTDERQPHDVRCRVGARVLWAAQAEDFQTVFDYYVQALRAADRRRPSEPVALAVDTLTTMLKSCISRDDRGDVLKELLPKYVTHHRDPQVAGGLKKLLREYGDPLVSQLEPQFRDPTAPGERSAVAQLLGHMAQHGGNVRAVEAMAGLLIDARGEGAKELTEAFVMAARGLSARDPTAESERVRRAFLDALDRFDQTTDPVLRSVAVDLRRLENEGVRPEVVEAYLRGRVDRNTAFLIRYCGPDGMNVLTAAAHSPARPADERQLAVETLGLLLNPRLRDQVPEHAWRVYLDDADPNVRAAALRVVVARGRTFSEAERERLARDAKTAVGPLRAAFDDHRSALFPPESPTPKLPATGTSPT